MKVDKLDPQSGTALEIGTSGDTISVPSGATLDISASTLTPPATMPASSGINLTALNATNLGSGTVATARGGTGTTSYTPGVTMAHLWLKEATQSISPAATAVLLTGNMKTANQAWSGSIGSDMTESSGIFTFPSTGIYKVEYVLNVVRDNNAQTYAGGQIQATTDDSAYSIVGYSYQWFENTASLQGSIYTSALIDVTDVANVKVKFMIISSASSAFTTQGINDENLTYFTFIRLGDT